MKSFNNVYKGIGKKRTKKTNKFIQLVPQTGKNWVKFLYYKENPSEATEVFASLGFWLRVVTSLLPDIGNEVLLYYRWCFDSEHPAWLYSIIL